MKDTVLKIHQSGKKIVLAITGGGAEAIGELLKYGHGSNTLLEAVVPYNQKSFNLFINGEPDKYCNTAAAKNLAMAAFQKGLLLEENQDTVIGIGCTASLSKENEREGRKHEAFISIQTAEYTSNYTLQINRQSREEEENFVAQQIIRAIAHACNIGDYKPSSLFSPPDEIRNLVLNKTKVYSFSKKVGQLIFPGSFNPFHQHHQAMAQKAYELTGKKVDLEVCIKNVDKPALDYEDLTNRENNLRNIHGDWLNNIHMTNLSKFTEKAEFFPSSVFIVGWDTFQRIGDPKYGNLDKVMAILKENRSHFMVFHRIINGRSTLENIKEIYAPLLDICTIYGPEILAPSSLSSKELRKK
jgi:hypothetical protein